jgi:alkylation response protein AidB-like acyl-CoA dehydrogenase
MFECFLKTYTPLRTSLYLWIKNLFAGTILGLGKPEQLTILEDMQSKGQLGCFALTEKFAGVNSGMIAGTTAHWDNSSQIFTINTPTAGARKNWISQGFVADKAVVVADLFVDGKSHGPHAFVMDLRVDGKVVEGVTLEDMGRKTVGNDLDNAAIHFDHIKVPKSALLNRYADIVDGKYVQAIKGIRTMDMIGQRLFSGRIAVAWAALTFRKKLFEMTKLYSDNKKCWGPDGDVPLTNIPQLKHLYIEAEDKAKDLETFAWKLEEELAACLVKSEIPSPELQEAIAIAKVRCVETSIDLCFRLKQEVGSYALMGGTGFEQADFLQCCKFAEGDTRILSQKIARDRFKVFSKSGKVVDEETKVAAELASNLVKDMKGGMDKFSAWDNNWTLVYKLANTRMDAVYNQYMKK